MRDKIKGGMIRLFGRGLDFRVRLFNVLAMAGVGISAATVALNLVTGMWHGAILSLALTLLSAGLLMYIYKTENYEIGYYITIVAIFMISFPIMFFSSGGYKSGMPSVFIFAILFTVLMLEGKKALIVSLLEIGEYSAICIYAFLSPYSVRWFESEWDIMADTMVSTALVSISCGLVLFLHLREYEAQKRQLQLQNEKLKHQDEAKSVFLTTVAHEIKNPLNAINLHARDTFELLEEQPEEIAIMQGNQQTIEKMVVRIDRIVVDLMDTVAIEQGRLALDLAPVRLSTLLKEASESYFGKNNIGENHLILDIDESLMPINADYARILQVVTNLLSNAMRHTKRGYIKITLREAEGCQVVTVSDNGEGMPEEIKSKVFKGYVSVSKEYWRHGIGLYVCYRIIEAHRGEINIESELGKGTAISFTLPTGR